MPGHQRIGLRRDATPLELGVGIGLCAVPFTFAVIVWWFGWRAGVAVALAVAMVIALACWVLWQSRRGFLRRGLTMTAEGMRRDRSWLWSRSGLVLLGFLLIAGFFVLTEHTAHVFGALPYLLLLACPLLHLFHRGHSGGHGSHRGRDPHERHADHDRGDGETATGRPRDGEDR